MHISSKQILYNDRENIDRYVLHCKENIDGQHLKPPVWLYMYTTERENFNGLLA